MSKLKINLYQVGTTPPNFNPTSIGQWKSKLFEVNLESITVPNNSDYGSNFIFSDDNLSKFIPKPSNANFTLALSNLPLQDDWFTRSIGSNRVVFSFQIIQHILNFHNIPLKNVVIRVLYAYSLGYLVCKGATPTNQQLLDFAHHDTRGCVFDFNPNKADVIFSAHHPQICPECVEKLKSKQISLELISSVQSEIRKIRKPLYFRLIDFIKLHPLIALLFTAIATLMLGIISSLVASYIYDIFKNH